MTVLVAQSCPTLCDPWDGSPSGSSVHGILQARILEWAAIPFSRGSSRPRDRTQIFCIACRFFTVWATGDAPFTHGSAYMSILTSRFSSTPHPPWSNTNFYKRTAHIILLLSSCYVTPTQCFHTQSTQPQTRVILSMSWRQMKPCCRSPRL